MDLDPDPSQRLNSGSVEAQNGALDYRRRSHKRRGGSKWSPEGFVDQWSQMRINCDEKLDPDPGPHQREKSELGPHQSEKSISIKTMRIRKPDGTCGTIIVGDKQRIGMKESTVPDGLWPVAECCHHLFCTKTVSIN
jgi:hypothetical protein